METTHIDEERKTIDTPSEIQPEEMILNMGPSHPSMHGIIQVVTKLQGEKIIDSDIIMGFLKTAPGTRR